MSNFPSFKELLQIVVKPREVIRKVVNADARKYFLWIAFILGIIGMFDLSAMSDLGEKYDLWTIIGVSILFALPYGYAVLSVFSVVVHWISRLFKGKANYFQTRAAISWAFAPRGINLVFWIINIAMLQVAAFYLQDPVTMAGPVFYTYQVTTFLIALVVVWTWVSSLQTLSEVNGYSAWVSLIVVVLSTFVLMGAWILLAMFANIFRA
ncbi:MAG: hypothetical protein FJZ60_02255 [Chlamydiae bacterium]|nr:hypothetical protein [Chlamydiota bacterium]